MTAFGRSECHNKKGHFSVEMHSVNRRYLEISVVLPKLFTSFEADIRKLVAEKLARGRVSVVVSIELNAERVDVVRPNLGYARALLRSYQLLARELGYDKEIDLSYVLRNKDVIEYVQHLGNMGAFWPPVSKCTERAMRQIMMMRKAEGRAIAEDFRSRLNSISVTLRGIRGNAEEAVRKYRQRLIDRIGEIGGNKLESDERLLREVAIYADRSDITEEITRLKSHIKQFRTYMKTSNAVGRTLDFLVQEMHREINTIGAKSTNLEISRNVVLIKSELEKIKEQVQNIA
jgi:uncharacterized protein (TIGR00255 family)